MKILVTIKRVTDYQQKVKIAPDGSSLITEGMSMVVNPFDEIAVEEALRLVKAHGGEVVVVSVGSKDATQQLRQGMAMGADRGVLLVGPDNLDPDTIARLLHKVVQEEKPDLVILGKQATDDDSNQVGQLLAGYLDWPQATFASKTDGLESDAEKQQKPGIVIASGKAQVVREVDGGLETLEVTLPAIVTTDLRLNHPRLASLPGIMKAKKKPLKETDVKTMGVDLAPRVKMTAFKGPPPRKAGVKVANVDELIQRLKNEAKVI